MNESVFTNYINRAKYLAKLKNANNKSIFICHWRTRPDIADDDFVDKLNKIDKRFQFSIGKSFGHDNKSLFCKVAL